MVYPSLANTPPKPNGMGINTNGILLPFAPLRSLDVKGIRGDVYSRDQVLDIGHAYAEGGFWQLWIASQNDPVSQALSASHICLDIEVANEPKLSGISPRDYVRTFAEVRKALKSVRWKGRLWGPSLSTWKDERFYLDECLGLGLKPDGLCAHGYMVSEGKRLDPSVIVSWTREMKSYGLPIWWTEIGFPSSLGPVNPYRVGALSDNIAAMKKYLAGETWVLFNGPNPASALGTGLFDSADGGATWTQFRADIGVL